jgi:hypothetical protein
MFIKEDLQFGVFNNLQVQFVSNKVKLLQKLNDEVNTNTIVVHNGCKNMGEDLLE